MFVRVDEVDELPQVGINDNFVWACYFFVLVFLVTHVGELTHLRPLHALISQVKKN